MRPIKFMGGLSDTKGHPIPVRRADIEKKVPVDLAIPANHGMNIKESENIDRYFSLHRELK